MSENVVDMGTGVCYDGGKETKERKAENMEEKSKRLRLAELVEMIPVEALEDALWVLRQYAAPGLNRQTACQATQSGTV